MEEKSDVKWLVTEDLRNLRTGVVHPRGEVADTGPDPDLVQGPVAAEEAIEGGPEAGLTAEAAAGATVAAGVGAGAAATGAAGLGQSQDPAALLDLMRQTRMTDRKMGTEMCLGDGCPVGMVG